LYFLDARRSVVDPLFVPGEVGVGEPTPTPIAAERPGPTLLPTSTPVPEGGTPPPAYPEEYLPTPNPTGTPTPTPGPTPDPDAPLPTPAYPADDPFPPIPKSTPRPTGTPTPTDGPTDDPDFPSPTPAPIDGSTLFPA
jgi:hypothetical protein